MFHGTDNSRHHGWTLSDSLSGSSNELFYSAGHTNFIYQLSVEVSLVRMSPKRTFESLFTSSWEQSCQHDENDTAAMKEKLVGAGHTKNGMCNAISSAHDGREWRFVCHVNNPSQSWPGSHSVTNEIAHIFIKTPLDSSIRPSLRSIVPNHYRAWNNLFRKIVTFNCDQCKVRGSLAKFQLYCD